MASAPLSTALYPTPRARRAALASVVAPRIVAPSSAVVLAVRELNEDVRAGYGSAGFRLRLLDNVTLSVRAGECVLVRGDRASGAHALRSILAGTRTVRSGARTVADGVAVKHATVSRDAVCSILEGWQAPRRACSSLPNEVFVLRVRDEPPQGVGHSRAQRTSVVDERWRTWAKSLRGCQGSIVAHVPWNDAATDATDHDAKYDTDYPTEYPTQAPSHAAHAAPLVHEGAAADDRSYGAFYQPSPPTVRTITLAAGRIVGTVPDAREFGTAGVPPQRLQTF